MLRVRLPMATCFCIFKHTQCKVPSRPISGILSRTVIPLGPSLLMASCSTPACSPNRVIACLFGLAPTGVYRTTFVTKRVVGSYPTVSSLPDPNCLGHRRFIFCCTFRRLLHCWIQRLAVSQLCVLWCPDFPHPSVDWGATIRATW